jgi:hypothetical protein
MTATLCLWYPTAELQDDKTLEFYNVGEGDRLFLSANFNFGQNNQWLVPRPVPEHAISSPAEITSAVNAEAASLWQKAVAFISGTTGYSRVQENDEDDHPSPRFKTDRFRGN